MVMTKGKPPFLRYLPEVDFGRREGHRLQEGKKSPDSGKPKSSRTYSSHVLTLPQQVPTLLSPYAKLH